ncbi:unnamed protein product [Calypogeia fissa]
MHFNNSLELGEDDPAGEVTPKSPRIEALLRKFQIATTALVAVNRFKLVLEAERENPEQICASLPRQPKDRSSWTKMHNGTNGLRGDHLRKRDDS